MKSPKLPVHSSLKESFTTEATMPQITMLSRPAGYASCAIGYHTYQLNTHFIGQNVPSIHKYIAEANVKAYTKNKNAWNWLSVECHQVSSSAHKSKKPNVSMPMSPNQNEYLINILLVCRSFAFLPQ